MIADSQWHYLLIRRYGFFEKSYTWRHFLLLVFHLSFLFAFYNCLAPLHNIISSMHFNNADSLLIRHICYFFQLCLLPIYMLFSLAGNHWTVSYFRLLNLGNTIFVSYLIYILYLDITYLLSAITYTNIANVIFRLNNTFYIANPFLIFDFTCTFNVFNCYSLPGITRNLQF